MTRSGVPLNVSDPAPEDGPERRQRFRQHLREHERKRLEDPISTALPERFTLRRELGRGGMGVVLHAFDRSLQRDVAVKILTDTRSGQDDRRRFLREAEALARIRHPNVVSVHEFLNDAGRLFLILEFVDGEPLLNRLEAGPLPVAEALRIALGVAEGLAAAHAEGVIHRDVKPANILMSRKGVPLLADFGVARSLAPSSRLTQSQALLGSPAYMAPEQVLSAKSADARSDVYSLGASLYHLLVGTPPFAATSLPQLLSKLDKETPQAPVALRAEVGHSLSSICLRCLEKDPAERYATAGELVADLRRCLAGEPIGRRPRTRRAGVFALALVAGAVAIAALAGIWPKASESTGACPAPTTPNGLAHPPSDASTSPDASASADAPPTATTTSPRPAVVYFRHPSGTSVSFLGSQDTRWLSAGADEVRLWKESTDQDASLVQKWPCAQVRWVASSPSGDRFAFGSADGTVSIADTADGRVVRSQVLPYLTRGGQWTDDGQTFFVTGMGGLTVATGPEWSLRPFPGIDYDVRCLAIARDGATLAVGTGGAGLLSKRALELWSTQGKRLGWWTLPGSPRCVREGPAPDQWIVGLAVAQLLVLDGQQARSTPGVMPKQSTWLASDPATGMIPAPNAGRTNVSALALLPSGLCVTATFGDGVEVSTWNVAKRQKVTSVVGNQRERLSLVASANGARIAVLSPGGAGCVWPARVFLEPAAVAEIRLPGG